MNQMKINSVAISHKGLVIGNNEDREQIFAIFDGMGGQSYGEKASYLAASILKETYEHDMKEQLDINSSVTSINKCIIRASEEIDNMANKLGVITREEARGHKSRFILTKYLGMPASEGVIEGTVSDTMTLKAGDVFLLCSDGLTDMVTDRAISEILSSPREIKQQIENLLNAALEGGGKDNITMILIKIEDESKEPMKAQGDFVNGTSDSNTCNNSNHVNSDNPRTSRILQIFKQTLNIIGVLVMLLILIFLLRKIWGYQTANSTMEVKGGAVQSPGPQYSLNKFENIIPPAELDGEKEWDNQDLSSQDFVAKTSAPVKPTVGSKGNSSTNKSGDDVEVSGSYAEPPNLEKSTNKH